MQQIMTLGKLFHKQTYVVEITFTWEPACNIAQSITLEKCSLPIAGIFFARVQQFDMYS